MKTETNHLTTLRRALRIIRADLKAIDWLPGGGPRYYDCNKGTLVVYHARSADGSLLLGLYEAELCDTHGKVLKTYEI